jgi:hypothetical protein
MASGLGRNEPTHSIKNKETNEAWNSLACNRLGQGWEGVVARRAALFHFWLTPMPGPIHEFAVRHCAYSIAGRHQATSCQSHARWLGHVSKHEIAFRVQEHLRSSHRHCLPAWLPQGREQHVSDYTYMHAVEIVLDHPGIFWQGSFTWSRVGLPSADHVAMAFLFLDYCPWPWEGKTWSWPARCW